MSLITRVLDRRVPKDFEHVDRHLLRGTMQHAALLPVPTAIETILAMMRQYSDEYDQGTEGACVGYSQSWMMSILNRKLYDAFRLYYEAQLIDEWPETPPAGGTSLRAGFDVLRTRGHWQVYAGRTRSPQLVEGITENRWATSVDDVRAAIAAGLPPNFGINWHRQFSDPKSVPRHGDKADSHRREYVIAPDGEPWGPVDGGHAITCVGASDKREAFALCNTWGPSYRFIVWLPYRSFERLLAADGEAGIVTDRVMERIAA